MKLFRPTYSFWSRNMAKLLGTCYQPLYYLQTYIYHKMQSLVLNQEKVTNGQAWGDYTLVSWGKTCQMIIEAAIIRSPSDVFEVGFESCCCWGRDNWSLHGSSHPRISAWCDRHSYSWQVLTPNNWRWRCRDMATPCCGGYGREVS